MAERDCDVKTDEKRDFIEMFSEALFKFLWYTEGAVSDTAIAEAFTTLEKSSHDKLGFVDALEFMKESAKAVLSMSIFTHQLFNKSVVDYFGKNAITRLSVFTFLASYCFHFHNITEDIFAVVLNTGSLIYRLFVFCRRMGHDEFVLYAAMCWSQIFKKLLKEDFYAEGGWDELRKYVAENRYANVNGGNEQRAMAAFLAGFNYLSMKIDPEQQPNPQTSDRDSDTTAGSLEELTLEDLLQTNSGVARFSFGGIAPHIPDFDKRIKAAIFQIVKANSKIAKHLKEYKDKQSAPASESIAPASESIAPASESSHNPIVDNTTIEELSQACLSTQITGDDHSSIDRNTTTEDEVDTVETSAEIREDSKETLV